MSTISLSLDEIYDLAKKTLMFNGCDEENASILSETIMKAEKDGSLSHGLFRLPAYVSGLKSGQRGLIAKPAKNRPETYYVNRPEMYLRTGGGYRAAKIREKVYG